MAEIPAFIDPLLLKPQPKTRHIEKWLFLLDRRLPSSMKGILYPTLYALPNFRTKQISCEGVTGTVFSRSKDEWYVTGNPVDEGAVGISLVRLFKEQKSKGVFLDIGASTGMYTVLALQAGMQVVAVEPDEQSFSILSQNTALNRKYRGQANLLQVALDQASGETILYGGGFKEACPSLVSTDNQQRQAKVSTRTLDDLVAGEFIEQPTVVKIDVEGAEGRVLIGGCNTLSDSRIKDLFVEIHPRFLPLFGSLAEEVWSMILGFGYKPIAVVPKQDELVCHFKRFYS